MAATTIRPNPQSTEDSVFIARSGRLRAVGRTMGEALDSLASQWGEIGQTTPVIIQHFGPDQFFTQAQYDRMQELRSRIGSLSADERAELESLIGAEIDATVARLGAFEKQTVDAGR